MEIEQRPRRAIGRTSPSRRMVIGMSSSEFRHPEHVRPIPQGEPPRQDFVISVAYLKAVQAAGAIPLVIPPILPGAIGYILDTIDALFVSGGPDIDPQVYGRKTNPEVGPTNLMTDTFQLGLIREADIRGMPILTVCRGTQLLNVARGGTLHQHIPEDFPESTINHSQTEDGEFATHQVTIDKDSLLFDALDTEYTEVNSFHHQAVERVGSNLKIVASAEDGVPESIEATDRDFVLGVQWHAESLTHKSDHEERLFRGLAEAAEARIAAS